MTASTPGPETLLRRLRWPLAATRAGMVAERALRAFWPFFTVVMAVLAALMLGVQDALPRQVVWIIAAASLLAALTALVFGTLRFRWPGRDEVLARLDATAPGHPIRAVLDAQTVGVQDPASRAVWVAHQARMAARAKRLRPPRPDLRIARLDPYALRYSAMLALAVALLFGSLWRVGSVVDLAPGGTAVAGGPSWEGWLEPPRYTGLPTIYLADVKPGAPLRAPKGSRVLLRLYGDPGALAVIETVSGEAAPEADGPQVERDLTVNRDGILRIDGPGGREWVVEMIPDTPPAVAVAGVAELRPGGAMTLPFTAQDDYGIVSGQATITLDLAAVERRHGLAAEPDPREPVTVDLPLPVTGDRTAFEEALVEDFSKHPWANLPVTITLTVRDGAGQKGRSDPLSVPLPARRFFDPLAAAVAEQRRDLLWARANAPRVAQILRAVSNRPDDIFRKETDYLRLRFIVRQLEGYARAGLTPQQQDEIAEALWNLAVALEEGDLSDALERMRRAQERLSQAMKNGASDAEIAELMQQLRRATDDYLRQLSRQARENGDNGQQPQGDSLQMSQDDLQRMMDRIQELMEQGRMAEAQEALREFQQMMENMRVTQGQGRSGRSDGQRALDGLAETLRRQQGLSDQAFRELQERFDPDARSGQGERRRAEGPEGRQGRGQGQDQGQAPRGGDAEGGEGSLADRQQALREELRRQQQGLPGAGTPEGDAARESLDRAGRAMKRAEEALREDDLAGALDRQSEAMEALREGMRSLGEALAQTRRNRQGQGSGEGAAGGRERDPLGRRMGNNGVAGTGQDLLNGEDVYRRARELLDEIRRRSGDAERPRIERDYLRRLLDRFGDRQDKAP